jgi:hypothetical protein
MCNCTKTGEGKMSQADLMKYGIAAGILWAAYKYGGAQGKVAAVAIGSVAVAKRLPYVQNVL